MPDQEDTHGRVEEEWVWCAGGRTWASWEETTALRHSTGKPYKYAQIKTQPPLVIAAARMAMRSSVASQALPELWGSVNHTPNSIICSAILYTRASEDREDSEHRRREGRPSTGAYASVDAHPQRP